MGALYKTERQQAEQLAIERWQAAFPFDLDEQTWGCLFCEFDVRDILQAIKFLQTTRSQNPNTIYSRFMGSLKKLNEERKPTWPPSDVQPRR